MSKQSTSHSAEHGARPLACHYCGSTDIEAIEKTEAWARWNGVMLDPDGTIWPACREAVFEYGDTDLRVELHCLGCEASWKPRRKWDPLHDEEEREPGHIRRRYRSGGDRDE